MLNMNTKKKICFCASPLYSVHHDRRKLSPLISADCVGPRMSADSATQVPANIAKLATEYGSFDVIVYGVLLQSCHLVGEENVLEYIRKGQPLCMQCKHKYSIL